MAIPYATKNELERLRRNLTTNSIQTISNEAKLNDLLSRDDIKDGMVFFREDLQKIFKASEDADGNLTIKELSVGSDLKIVEYEVELETGKVIGLKAEDLETLLTTYTQEKTLFAFYFTIPEEAGEELPFKKTYIFYGFLTYQIAVQPTVIDLGIVVGYRENELYHLTLTATDNDEVIIQCTKLNPGSSTYQPLEFTFTEDSDKNISVKLTNTQYNEILSAINKKEEIIAYGNYNLDGQAIKLPLTNPLKTLDNGSVLVYSGVCGYVSFSLGASTFNWVLSHNVDGEGSNILGLMPSPEFSNKYGLYISSSVTNEMSFADGAGYYDWNQSQGDKIKFDSINGKPILHTSADINSYYAPTTINTTETPKILQSKNSAMEWVDMPSTNTSLPLVRLTITPEQYQEFLVSEGNAQITFTEEQKEQLLANLPCMFWLAWPDADGVKSECLLSGFIAFSPFPIRGSETVNTYTVLFFIEGDTYVGTNSPTDTGTHDSHSTIDNLDLPIYFASYLQDDIGANQEGIIFSYRTGEDLLIKFPKINNTQIADNANNYYAPTELNATSTPKILQCVNSTMSWVDVKTYYSHDLTLDFNGALLSLGFTSTSNTKITTIEALKTALTGRTQVSINGAFKVGELLNIVSKYNPTTNKITVFNGTASVEIALETAGDYTLGAITDEVVEIQ